MSHLRGASGYILVADGSRAVTLTKAVEPATAHYGYAGAAAVRAGFEQNRFRDRWEVQA